MKLKQGGGPWPAALLCAALASGLVMVAARKRCRRYLVAGHSMEPTIRDGDWVLVDATAYAARRPRIGDVVVAIDPREPARAVFKRVARRNPNGLWLLGDSPQHSTDSRDFGWVGDEAVLGRAWFRYWPAGEFGFIH
jgi:nickel-type superoxide dismutase maturation protease